jgi:thiosulfate reductase cytochrome b subunit
VRLTHWVTAAAFGVLLLSGIAILLAHPRLYWGETGGVGGPSLVDLPLPFVLDVPIRGPGRYLHFLAAWILVFTGIVYVVAGALAGHFRRRFVPRRGTLTRAAVLEVVRGHLRRSAPGEHQPGTYNVLQRLSYAMVVFVAVPLTAISGLAMSPAVTSVVPATVTVFGGQQSARTVHFAAACALVGFALLHVLFVWQSGFAAQMRAMTLGDARGGLAGGRGLRGLSRRDVILGAASLAVTAGAWRAFVRGLDRHGLLPANCRGIYGASETVTYAGQRLLTRLPSMAREFDRSRISTVVPVNGPAPKTPEYQRLLAGGFAEWRLSIEGLVERPGSMSLPDLKRFPARTQITHQACEEGWSFIAEWTGVPLLAVLDHVGMRPEARFVFFFTFDGWWDSLDMDDVRHPQTLLAYAMNGPEMPLDHGAPLRLKVPRQLGYKHLKYLTRIVVTDTQAGIGDGLGSGGPSAGYSWYAGI